MKNLGKYIALFILLLLASGWFVVIYFVNANEELKQQIDKRDLILKDRHNQDSILNKETKRYSDTITKYVSGSNFSIGNRKVSIEEIVRMFNNELIENFKLKDSLFKTKAIADFYTNEYKKNSDSFHIYKRIAELAADKYNIKYNVDKIDNGFVLKRDKSSSDSIFINQQIVSLIKKNYGLTYDVTKKEDGSFVFVANFSYLDSILIYKTVYELIKERYNINYSASYNKDGVKSIFIKENTVDSALVLFPYFRHLLSVDKEKNQWIIDLAGKELRKSRSIKK